jgi:hypothetical protein
VDYPDQHDIARSDVVIPDEPALISLICLRLSGLVECSSHQFQRKRSGGSINITCINFTTFPATYFANFSSEMVSLGGDPF